MRATASSDHADRAADVAVDRGNSARTGQMPGPGPAGAPRERWRFDVGEDNVASAIVAGGIVYVGGTYEPLYAIAAASGQERWRFTGSGEVRGISSRSDLNGRTAAYADGLVYVCSTWARREHALVYAVDARSGQEQWQFAVLGNDIMLPTTVAAGIVYVVDRDTGTPHSSLYALDAATGRERWRYSAEGQMYNSPAVADGVLFIGSTAGNFYALDAASGQELWRFQTRNPFVDDRYAHVSHAAVAAGGVYLSSSSNELLFALDAASGQELWRLPGMSWMPPTVADGVVYTVSGDKSLIALAAATGQALWRFPPADPADGLVTIPVVADGVVYIGSRTGVLFAIDAALGQERWRVPIDDEFAGSSPAVIAGVVYAGGFYGSLFAIAGADTPLPAARGPDRVTLMR